jgi:hypothetical protein
VFSGFFFIGQQRFETTPLTLNEEAAHFSETSKQVYYYTHMSNKNKRLLSDMTVRINLLF